MSNNSPILHVLDEDDRVTASYIFDGLDNTKIIIGRSPNREIADAAILLDDPFVSSAHSQIWLMSETKDHWMIEDLGSINGTLLNDLKIGYWARPIKDGDIIQVGHTRLRFELSLSQPKAERLTREDPIEIGSILCVIPGCPALLSEIKPEDVTPSEWALDITGHMLEHTPAELYKTIINLTNRIKELEG